MHVTVRYYAMLRERKGRDEEQVTTMAGATARSLYEQLFDEPRVPVQVAVDHAICGLDTPLTDGCEVVFLPPVGGG